MNDPFYEITAQDIRRLHRNHTDRISDRLETRVHTQVQRSAPPLF
jgi:hypothetical protein